MFTGTLPDALRAATTVVADAHVRGPGGVATAVEVVEALRAAGELVRVLDRAVVEFLAFLDQDGELLARGYRDTVGALTDLLGWDRGDARPRVVAAEQAWERVGLSGEILSPALPATAVRFAAGEITVRHVAVLADLMDSPPARRLDAETWAQAEAELAGQAEKFTPRQLHGMGRQLLELLDADGPAPDDKPPSPMNELRVTRRRDGGGSLKGRFDDPAEFAAITTAIDAAAGPRDGDDQRTVGERQADALAEVCAQVLDHGTLPETGGSRPQVVVHVRLDDLQRRARAAFLDTGGVLSPDALRRLACDAAVIPVVLGGAGQPLDVGRATRTIPDGLRRAVLARDGGCAHPGCDRPASWTEIHHVVPWSQSGRTAIDNAVALCRVHHRSVHQSGWEIRFAAGIPEFVPPAWIDPTRTPRRRPRLDRRSPGPPPPGPTRARPAGRSPDRPADRPPGRRPPARSSGRSAEQSAGRPVGPVGRGVDQPGDVLPIRPPGRPSDRDGRPPTARTASSASGYASADAGPGCGAGTVRAP